MKPTTRIKQLVLSSKMSGEDAAELFRLLREVKADGRRDGALEARDEGYQAGYKAGRASIRALQTAAAAAPGNARAMAKALHELRGEVEEAERLFLQGAAILTRSKAALEALPPSPLTPAAPGRPERAAFRVLAQDSDSLKQVRTIVLTLLEGQESISRVEAEKALQDNGIECTPILLRRIFRELEADHLVTRTGNTRGTRYSIQITS